VYSRRPGPRRDKARVFASTLRPGVPARIYFVI
jgi:hypothetical protein